MVEASFDAVETLYNDQITRGAQLTADTPCTISVAGPMRLRVMISIGLNQAVVSTANARRAAMTVKAFRRVYRRNTGDERTSDHENPCSCDGHVEYVNRIHPMIMIAISHDILLDDDTCATGYCGKTIST